MRLLKIILAFVCLSYLAGFAYAQSTDETETASAGDLLPTVAAGPTCQWYGGKYKNVVVVTKTATTSAINTTAEADTFCLNNFPNSSHGLLGKAVVTPGWTIPWKTFAAKPERRVSCSICELPCTDRSTMSPFVWYSFDQEGPDRMAPRANYVVHGAVPIANEGPRWRTAYFKGSPNYFEFAHRPLLNVGASDFSIEMRIKAEPISGLAVRTIANKRKPPSGTQQNFKGYEVFLHGNDIGIQLADGFGYSNFVFRDDENKSRFRVADGNWHQVSITLDKSDPYAPFIWFWLDESDGLGIDLMSSSLKLAQGFGNNAPLLLGANDSNAAGYWIDDFVIRKAADYKFVESEDLCRY